MADFQIPEQFELFHRTWKVRKLTRKQEASYRGLCDPNHGIIYLQRDLHPDELLQTFFHELGHALMFSLEYEFETDEEEEAFVDSVGGLLAQFMKSQVGSFS